MKWESVPFLSAARDASGGSPKVAKGKLASSGGLAVIDQGKGLIAGFVDDVSLAQRNELPVIVFGDHTRVFKFADFPFAAGADGVKILSCREGFDPKFLYWYLSSLDVPSPGYSRHFKFLKEKKVPKPPLTEQRRIAEVLDQVDTLRAKRRETINLLDGLAHSIFLEMFSPREGHPVVRLGDQLSFITSGGRGWAKYYSDTGSIFIRSLDVQMNSIKIDEVAYVQAPNNAEARRTRVEHGDVLLTITGSRIGRVSPVPKYLEGAYVSQHVAILRPIPERVLPDFLSFYLSIPDGGQAQISRMQYGQTKPGLNFKQIADFSIPAPDISLQHEFISRIAQVARLRTTYMSHLAALNELFVSLQQRAFSGPLWDHDGEAEAA